MDKRWSALLARPKHNSIPWGLAGMVALVFTTESFVVRHWLDLTDPVSLSWRYSACAARTEVRDTQILCLGDSLVKHGLVPSVIERTSGQKAVNLSAARASTVLTYCLLRRALDSGARPKALIVNAKPAVLLGGPAFNARPWQEILCPHDLVELLQITKNAPFVASTLLGRALPSLRARLEIQAAFTAAIQGETDSARTINSVLWRNWTVNNGANVASAIPAYGGELKPEVERQLYTDIFHIDPANVEAIERTLKLATTRRIPLFWVLFPLSANLQARRDRSGAEMQHEAFIRSLVARYRGTLIVLDARRLSYPDAFFADATHLNSRGAIALSRSVAAAIAARETMPGPPSSKSSWVVLDRPNPSGDPWADSVEDIEQSKRIVSFDRLTRTASR